jgi:hypothetical protein
MKKPRVTLVSIALLGVAFAFVFGPTSLAADEKEGASSSSCISCHTDLAKMDSYGAATGGAGAAIAG